MTLKAALVISCVSATAVATGASARSRTQPVGIEMRNVRLHVDQGIVLDIRTLQGRMISRVAGRPPVFDNQDSFVLHVDRAEMSMDMTSLANLMNDHVFAYDGAPIQDIKVKATDDGRLEQSGKLRKGIVVPFSMKATIAPTADGRLQLHLDSMKALGIPAKGLLDLFHLELDDLVNLKRRRGISVQDNDIILAPGEVLPPPEIRGHITSAVVTGDRLVQTFGNPKQLRRYRKPAPRAANYIYFSGNVITFGKLTMSGADLQLIDMDPRDPFDFYPTRYSAQLVAGYSKNTPQKGLKTYMPDYDDLQVRRARRTPAAPEGAQARR